MDIKMFRLHLIEPDAKSIIKCIKCDCILLTEPCSATSNLQVWETSLDNCDRVKPAAGKPTFPIQSSKY